MRASAAHRAVRGCGRLAAIVAVGTFAAALSATPLEVAAPGRGTTTERAAVVAPETPSPSEGRRRLVEMALDVATAIPVEPHVKDRSRAQEDVVAACLAMGDAAMAKRAAAGISNWRRGVAYADIAIAAARRGDLGEMQECLILANETLQTSDDWRRDRIRVRIAEAQLILGQRSSAMDLVADADPVERARLARASAAVADAESFDEQMAAMAPVLATGGFDQVRASLEACVELYGRLYVDAERRSRAEAAIRQGWGTVPHDVRVHLLLGLSRQALLHQDKSRALELACEAQRLVESREWSAEDQVALRAQVARGRAEAGDRDGAVSGATAALECFTRRREEIAGMFRGRGLRAAAEAFAAASDTAMALQTYGLALDEGAANPNARPRALDLGATCLSMAAAGIEPDENLWSRIRAVRAGLIAPW